MFKKILRVTALFTGWVLSPFTWWNDAFINMPLSYFLANIIYSVTGVNFQLLVICSYWVTNIIGLLLIYLGGKSIIINSRRKLYSVIMIIIVTLAYSGVMIYLDTHGKLLPLKEYFKK
ncbi:MAG: hypothetical protein ABH843_08150 [Candidatus Omnitrophota bacterium]